MKEETSIPRLLWLAHRNTRARGPGSTRRGETRRELFGGENRSGVERGMKSSYGVASLCRSIPRVLMPSIGGFLLYKGKKGKRVFFSQRQPPSAIVRPEFGKSVVALLTFFPSFLFDSRTRDFSRNLESWNLVVSITINQNLLDASLEREFLPLSSNS